MIKLYKIISYILDLILRVNTTLYYHICSCSRLAQKHSPFQVVKFYRIHSSLVNANIDILCDDLSKQIYKKTILMRQQYHNRRYKPHPYFDSSVGHYQLQYIHYFDDEVIIDCGVGNPHEGENQDTIEMYTTLCSNYKHIYGFEPDPENYRLLKEKYKNHLKVTIINAGVYEKADKLPFIAKGCSSSHLLQTKPHRSAIITGDGDIASTDTTSYIDLVAIDSLQLDRVTLIKMDVEGAELPALRGAEQTILRHKPKLAISIYHNEPDMVFITQYIHRLVPEYQLYVRHYSINYRNETVLFALLPHQIKISKTSDGNITMKG